MGSQHTLARKPAVVTSTRTKAFSLLDGQRRALARIAAGDPVAEVLHDLVRHVDVAARKQAEEALRNQTRRLETFQIHLHRP